MRMYVNPEKIRAARISAFKTQADIARSAGIGLSTYERLERGAEPVGVRRATLFPIAKALGVEIDELLDRVEA